MFLRRSRQDLVRAAARLGVRSQRVVAAMRAVDRAGFVPPGRERLAYRDRPILIDRRQATPQPSIVALMIQALELDGDERVLEVGTGVGYQAALLARLARDVFSVERSEDLAEQARSNLAHAEIANVTVVTDDPTRGLPEYAPFDAILVSAAAPEVAQPLGEQLVDGGRLVMPIGPGGEDLVTLFVRQEGRLRRVRVLTAASFAPLR
ncbi:MAG: protein-L-isoaspartate(D-aspartate) O-methyltransferase [Actinobacteria bacterium]|nr:protein-L-isoaspartate(D-aspartate) O-methyltransferase [Actinomycetota bacterium]